MADDESQPTLSEYVEGFRERVLQDALAEATSHYWMRRAADFAAVGTPACDEIAQACRNAAAFARWDTTHPDPCCAVTARPDWSAYE